MGRGLSWTALLITIAAMSACGDPESGRMAPASAPQSTVRGGVLVDADAAPPAAVVLVRTADLSVTVDAYDDVRAALVAWLAESGGFVADEQVWRADGRATGASLRVRVPADQLDAMLGWLDAEAVVDSMDVRAADVTAEWVDLEARIAAHEAAEERLLGLLADRTASLADVLAAETQLTRVRSEIEALRGRHRVLADQVALATANLRVRVRQPVSLSGAEPLVTEAGRALWGSIGAMGQVLRGLVIVVAALAPWVVPPAALVGLMALIGGGLAGILVRRNWRRRGSAALTRIGSDPSASP